MNTLIILAHGSRRQESNAEIASLAKQVEKCSDNEYDITAYAFLELAEPDLSQCIENMITYGASDITIFPYFLNSGNHVTCDIPALIKEANAQYPDCRFRLTSFIGKHKDIPNLILELANLE